MLSFLRYLFMARTKVKTKLELLIDEAGVNAERIAADADVRAGTMSKYLHGNHSPSVSRAIRICRALSEHLGREVSVFEVFE